MRIKNNEKPNENIAVLLMFVISCISFLFWRIENGQSFVA